MNQNLSKPWLPLERIHQLVQLEPALLLLSASLVAWFLYKFLLRKVNEERHQTFRREFARLGVYAAGVVICVGAYALLVPDLENSRAVVRIAPYVGLAALVFQALLFIKVCKIFLLEYLFASHMREGVPILLVDLFTLVLTALTLAVLSKEVFTLQVGPFLATSAIFSIILGLALQDTLGNLFAGISLQFDKPYDLDDWVEVSTDGAKWVGQVKEVSWRATLLYAVTEELITIPNKVIAQAQIANFSASGKPFIRKQTFRVPYGSEIPKVKEALITVARGVRGVRKDLSPTVFVNEAGESWISVSLIYFLDDYGTQWNIADQMLEQAIPALERVGVRLAAPRLQVMQ
jgi:small-conductance mechanosensitive channel